MKRFASLALVVFFVMPAGAAQDGQVLYVGGTVSTVKAGEVGELDTTSPLALSFESASGKVEIPYAQMDSYEYSQPVAHHLGVLPAIAVGLVKKRQRRHIFRITYHKEDARPEVAIFEVSKQIPRSLLAVLQARAPQGCRAQPNRRCGDSN